MDEEISQRAPFSGGDEEESDASEETDQLEQQSDRLQQPAEIDDELVKDSVIEEKVIEEEKKEENNQEKEEELENQWVWYPDDKLVWNRGIVLSTTYVDNPKGPGWREYLISISENPPIIRKIRSDKVHRVDQTHLDDLDNLCLMNDMHEAPLLDLLRRRFDQKFIYTYTGDVLISVNPYEIIAGLYTDPMNHFDIFPDLTSSEKAKSGGNEKKALRPHVYQISNKSLRSLVYGTVVDEQSLLQNGNKSYFNQSIIISGESGAGKTENSKHVVNFLIEANNYLTRHQSSASLAEERFADYLKGILVESSVVLEAFGNAKTVRNDNSSRFGKYIKLVYGSVTGKQPNSQSDVSDIPKLVSAVIETFLLEKSRLAYVGQGERSYHVFYQLLIGLQDAQQRNSLNLTDAKEFKMLSQGGCCSTEEDHHEFNNTLKALETLQCSAAEVKEIWKILATILHLGNLDLILDESAPSGTPVTVLSPTYSLEQIADNIGVGVEQMITSLTTQQLIVVKRSSIKVKILSKAEVANNVFALIKWLYSKLFDWIVSKINYCFITSSSSALTNQDKRNGFIGILDIFGFEILGVNSFEQLCINFTNERLQQQFNEFVFVTEQAMYRNEGLQWSNITFKDNQPVIDLIAATKKPLGLLLLLEEQGMLNRKPDDIALLATFNQIHEMKDAKGRVMDGSIYSKSRFGKDAFSIKHFAGDVTYAVDGFLMKNNDSLQDDLITLLNTSNSHFLRNVMNFSDTSPDQLGYIPPVTTTALSSSVSPIPATPTPEPTRTTASGKKMASAASVSLQFRLQLDSLMATLTSTTPNYIKCVKPNPLKAKEIFDPNLVIQQLRYSGVLEVVRIRREGFPVRIGFQAFYRDFEILARGKPKDIFVGPENCTFEQAKKCADLLATSSLPADSFQVGHSLLFLRQNGLTLMQEAVRKFYSNQVLKIQSKYRSILLRRKFVRTIYLVIQLQKEVRRHAKQSFYKRQKHAAQTIKYFYISKRLRQQFILRYKEILSERRQISALIIQTNYRGMRQRVAYKAMYKAWVKLRYKSALTVQCAYRCFISRNRFRRRLEEYCATKIQSIIRMRLQLIEYLTMQSAIIAIQTVLRRFLYRMRYLRQREKVIVAQSAVRKFLKRSSYLQERRKVILVQSLIRRYLATINVFIQQAAILCLQTWIRSRLTRYHYKRKRDQVILIQSLIRCHLIQGYYRFVLKKVTYLQAVVRGFFTWREYVLRYSAILCLQSFGRMINARRRFQSVLVSTITVQAKVRAFIYKCRFQAIRAKVTKCNAIIRGFIQRKRFQHARHALIKLQSFGKMINARRAYTEAVINIIIVQSLSRRVLAIRRYNFVRSQIIKIEKLIRGYLQRLHYKNEYNQVVKLQSFGRMINARRVYNEVLISAIILQTIIRGFLSIKFYRRVRLQIIKLQSWYRMHLAKRDYGEERRRIIKIQSVARMHNAIARYQIAIVSILCIQAIIRRGINRNRFLLQKASCILIQSHIRKQQQKKRYLIALRAETTITKYYRRFVAVRRYKSTIKRVKRIQVAVRRFLKNIQLKYRLAKFHQSCMDLGTTINQVDPHQKRQSITPAELNASKRKSISPADLNASKRKSISPADLSTFTGPIISHLTRFPEDRFIRVRKQALKSMFHSLIVSGVDEIFRALNLSCTEAFDVDRRGRNAVHYFAMYPHMKSVYAFAEAINQFRVKSNVNAMDVLDFDDDNDNDNDGAVAGPLAQIKEALHMSVGNSSLKSGWLKKKRGGMMWQKRWVVLTEDYMIYYKNPQSINNPKFAIPLEGCTVQRLTGSKDPIVELIAPNMGEKKTLFGSSTKKSMTFLAESEKDLQEWLIPLKAVAGVGTLRTSNPVKYINTDIRRLWVNVQDIENDTPLHTLVKVLSGQLKAQHDSNYVERPVNIEDAIHFICWIVEFGCPVNAQNLRGETALFLAVVSNLDKNIVRALMLKGADPRIGNVRGIAPLELMNNNPDKKRLYFDVLQALNNMKTQTKPVAISNANGAASPNVERNNYSVAGKLKGYSYLSLLFNTQTFFKAPQVSEDPSIVISVYNEKKQLLETARDIRGPAAINTDANGGTIIWGQSWHMQTPLENLEPNSYLMVEYRPRGETLQASGSINPPIAPLSATFLIDLNTIDSCFQNFDVVPVMEAGKQINPILLNQEKSTIQTELILSRRNRPIDLKTILCSV